MARPSVISIPWDTDSYVARSSISSRISGLFGQRQAGSSRRLDTERNTATFEVPLFLSPTRYEPPSNNTRDSPTKRSNVSTRSVLDAAASLMQRVRPLTLPTSSRYSSPAPSPTDTYHPKLCLPEEVKPMHYVVRKLQPANTTKPCPSNSTTTIRQRRRRRNSIRRRIQAFGQLSIAFGVTFFLTAITYLVLAVTGVASGIMFHILSLLLLLCLAGAFLHSFVKMLVLRRQRRERVRRHPATTWPVPGAVRGPQESVCYSNTENSDEVSSDHAIPIVMAGDEIAMKAAGKLSMPPPVYGNFRNSKRMNPNLVHWRKVPPSPLTPTYAEAMNDVQREVGYRPPSYLVSESGATQIIETQRRDVDRALRDVHPLERERYVGWAGQAF